MAKASKQWRTLMIGAPENKTVEVLTDTGKVYQAQRREGGYRRGNGDRLVANGWRPI